MAHRLRVEALGSRPGPELTAEVEGSVARALADDAAFVLERDGCLVASTAFNARLPDAVQVGGVWTPPALRGRGYARAAVAGSLQMARDEGATGAILFTDAVNVAAIKAYTSLGFRAVGDYALVVLA